MQIHPLLSEPNNESDNLTESSTVHFDDKVQFSLKHLVYPVYAIWKRSIAFLLFILAKMVLIASRFSCYFVCRNKFHDLIFTCKNIEEQGERSCFVFRSPGLECK